MYAITTYKLKKILACFILPRIFIVLYHTNIINMARLLLLITFLISPLFIHYCSATTISAGDKEVLKFFWQYAEKKQLSKLSVNERIPFIARFFLDFPYKSNTLNVTKKELPIINVQQLDCVTLVENVLALALLEQYNDNSTESFVGNIVKIRYRDGKIEDYSSRLHYSSDWLYEMQKQNILADVTQAAGGIKYPKQIDFMTRNYTKYPVMNQDKTLVQKIKAIETEMNKRTYYYIPKGKVNEVSNKIENGDVVLITTNISGLDTSHLGFALKKDNKTYLIHASSAGKKVMITELPLQEYMEEIKSQTGIMLGRMAAPKIEAGL